MFDAHTHLNFEAFDGDRDQVIDRAIEAGVRGVLIADYDARRRDLSIGISERPGVWCTHGIHPWAAEATKNVDLALASLADAIQGPAVGIGEIGLDFLHAESVEKRAHQEHLFRAQLDLARLYELPVVVHCLRAEARLIEILKSDGQPKVGGMMHGYSGSAEQAAELVKLGFDISIGTSITLGNARRVVEVVRRMPPERLIAETDSPDRPPTAARSARNEPAFLNYVISAIASAMNLPEEEVSQFTEQNVRRRFGLNDDILEKI